MTEKLELRLERPEGEATPGDHFTLVRGEDGELVFTPPVERDAARRFLLAVLKGADRALEPAALPEQVDATIRAKLRNSISYLLTVQRMGDK